MTASLGRIAGQVTPLRKGANSFASNRAAFLVIRFARAAIAARLPVVAPERLVRSGRG
jgi:hypothetical protein